MKGKVVSIHSFRGGTGKSNLTANLACTVAAKGMRVAVIDTDIQSPGIHVLFGLREPKSAFMLNDFLWGQCPIEDAAIDLTALLHASAKGAAGGAIYLVPSSVDAGAIARILHEGYEVSLLNDGIQSLSRKLDLDFVFIDTHPGVNEETLLSIAISDTLFVVMRPDQQDFQGTAVTVELARELDVVNMNLVINKALPAMNYESLKQKAESIFATPVACVLPMSEDMLHLGSDGIFSLLHPEHPYSAGIRLLAEIVANRRSPVENR